MKTAGLRIRVEPTLRDTFVRICKAKDLTAAQVIRAFMREYVENNKEPYQTSLFDLLHEPHTNLIHSTENNEKI